MKKTYKKPTASKRDLLASVAAEFVKPGGSAPSVVVLPVNGGGPT
ncbi:MAG: hypothetical protein AAGG69_03500 [Pseudomonadota bacterium]